MTVASLLVLYIQRTNNDCIYRTNNDGIQKQYDGDGDVAI